MATSEITTRSLQRARQDHASPSAPTPAAAPAPPRPAPAGATFVLSPAKIAAIALAAGALSYLVAAVILDHV
ncbi:hypothetical protein DIE07_07165 [Burkholderia sp. Bp9002]|nr:hypothetical protein DIE07_07165 [Burkholderia sp. Bp9002]